MASKLSITICYEHLLSVTKVKWNKKGMYAYAHTLEC